MTLHALVQYTYSEKGFWVGIRRHVLALRLGKHLSKLPWEVVDIV